jgi:hypothetical protein
LHFSIYAFFAHVSHRLFNLFSLSVEPFYIEYVDSLLYMLKVFYLPFIF